MLNFVDVLKPGPEQGNAVAERGDYSEEETEDEDVSQFFGVSLGSDLC